MCTSSNAPVQYASKLSRSVGQRDSLTWSVVANGALRFKSVVSLVVHGSVEKRHGVDDTRNMHAATQSWSSGSSAS